MKYPKLPTASLFDFGKNRNYKNNVNNYNPVLSYLKIIVIFRRREWAFARLVCNILVYYEYFSNGPSSGSG